MHVRYMLNTLIAFDRFQGESEVPTPCAQERRGEVFPLSRASRFRMHIMPPECMAFVLSFFAFGLGILLGIRIYPTNGFLKTPKTPILPQFVTRICKIITGVISTKWNYFSSLYLIGVLFYLFLVVFVFAREIEKRNFPFVSSYHGFCSRNMFLKFKL